MTPRAVQAARMRQNGKSVDEIAEHFGWTYGTTSTNIARGKKWGDFLKKNVVHNRIGYSKRRPQIIRRLLRKWAAEAVAAGLDPIAIIQGRMASKASARVAAAQQRVREDA